jgi:hypothetical protein
MFNLSKTVLSQVTMNNSSLVLTKTYHYLALLSKIRSKTPKKMKEIVLYVTPKNPEIAFYLHVVSHNSVSLVSLKPYKKHILNVYNADNYSTIDLNSKH